VFSERRLRNCGLKSFPFGAWKCGDYSTGGIIRGWRSDAGGSFNRKGAFGVAEEWRQFVGYSFVDVKHRRICVPLALGEGKNWR
jgi:hypothetical protein